MTSQLGQVVNTDSGLIESEWVLVSEVTDIDVKESSVNDSCGTDLNVLISSVTNSSVTDSGVTDSGVTDLEWEIVSEVSPPELNGKKSLGQFADVQFYTQNQDYIIDWLQKNEGDWE